MAALCNATGECSLCIDQFPPDQGEESWSAQGLHYVVAVLKQRYTLACSN